MSKSYSTIAWPCLYLGEVCLHRAWDSPQQQDSGGQRPQRTGQKCTTGIAYRIILMRK